MLFFPTADEDFKYFRSQGYTGSINDMHYKALGDLGYTGSLNDRIHAYLTATYGSYYEAMRDLRNGTSVFSLLSAYAVNNFDPDFVLDFKNSVYKTGGSATTISSAITHARASSATMTDSDGKIKWSPHNLLIRSEELNLWTQSGTGSVVVDNAVAPDGTTTAATLTFGSANFIKYIRSFGTYTLGDKITFSFWARSDTVTTLGFGINGGASTGNNNIFTNVAVTSTWNLVEFEFTILQTDASSLYYIIGSQGTNPVAGQLGDVEIWHPHAYRSDLGGMVNNSETGNSYVPTTSSAVYLPRVGHHIYNGSAWVNEGILHESEARTNLVTHSEDLSNVSWVKQSGTTVTANQATSPASTTTADLVVGNGTSGIIYYSPTSTAGVAETFARTVWIKSVTGTPTVTIKDPVFTNVIVSCNLTTDWQSFVLTAETTSNSLYKCGLWVDDIPSSGIYIWGAQIESGSTPSSYIPTSGSTVTRAADALTVPAANLPYSSTNMSIQMDGKMTGNNLTHIRWFEDADDAILLETGTNNFTFTQEAGGTVDTVTGGSFTSGNLLAFNTASRHGSGFINGAISGTALTANTTPSALPDLADNNLVLGYDFMGTIGKLRVWDEDLTDTGIAEAST